jgi:hypothetical protein
MRSTAFYIVACVLAALVPLLPVKSKQAGGETTLAAFPGWPTHFEGRALTLLPLSEREQRFTRDFPGLIARFTDGEREIIIRWVTEATRKLHPASDCFEGVGYSVHPSPLQIDKDGRRWGSFKAVRQTEKLRVRERIYTDAGQSWTDISAWYWAAAAEDAPGPWWAVTVAENITEATP